MSTTPVNPQPPVATPAQPAAPAAPSEMTPEQIRNIAAGTPVAAPAAAPTQLPSIPGLPPIERQADGSLAMKLPTGQVYKGANEWELMAELAKGQVNSSAHITNISQETERLRQGLAAVTGTGTPGQPGQSQFDRAVYMELQAQDPIIAANYLDQHRFGFQNINDVVPTFQRTAATAEDYRTQVTVNNFRNSNPDFPGTQQAVDAVMGFMKTNNIPFTADNLGMVHQQMVRAQKYQPLVMNPNANQQPGMPTTPAQPTAPAPGFNPATYDPNPAGLYAFGPGGFGTSNAPAPAAPAAPMPAAPAAPQYAYPTMPNVSQPATPVPMGPNTTMTIQPGQAITEDTMNGQMSKEQLRQFIETNLR